jgi:hypothetical protein
VITAAFSPPKAQSNHVRFLSSVAAGISLLAVFFFFLLVSLFFAHPQGRDHSFALSTLLTRLPEKQV